MKKFKLNDITLEKLNSYVILNKTNTIDDEIVLQNYKEVVTGKIIFFILFKP